MVKMRWERLELPAPVSALKHRWNNRNSATPMNSTSSSSDRATKTPISHRGSVYHQTVQTVLCGFNLKRLYSLIFIKAVLNNAKTHDAVLKRIKPRFTIKKITITPQRQTAWLTTLLNKIFDRENFARSMN